MVGGDWACDEEHDEQPDEEVAGDADGIGMSGASNNEVMAPVP